MEHNYKKPKKSRIIVEKCPINPADGKSCECHQVGQVFEYDFERCPQNFCAAAFHTLWPALRVLELGGRHPWDDAEGVTRVSCPDPNINVVFRIETE